jgi:outer membrane protein
MKSQPVKYLLQNSLASKFFFSGLLFFCFSSTITAQIDNTVWSLNQCVDYAVANNVTVKQGKLQTQINKNNLQSAQWDYAPNLSLGTNYAWNFGLNIDPVTNQISQETRQTANMQLSSNWVLFDGGRKFNSIDRANFNYLASLYEYEDIANNIKINVANAFLQILLNKEISNVAKEQLRITQFQTARMKDRVEAGASPEGDLLQLEAQEARDQQSLIAAQNAVQLSKIQLANLLQLPNPQDFDIAEPDLAVPDPTVISRNADGIYQVALENQPVIKGAELRVKSSEEAIKISQAGYLPSLSLIGQVGSSYSDQIPNVTGVNETIVPIGEVAGTGQLVTTLVPQQFPVFDGTKPFNNQVNDNLNQFVGINLTVPLFNRFTVKNAVQNARLQQEISQLNLEQEKNNLRQTIYQAHADAKASYNSYLAAQKSTTASQKALDYAQERFKVGALNQVDFEQAKNNFIGAKSQMIQSKYDYIFRIKVLEFYLTNQIN